MDILLFYFDYFTYLFNRQSDKSKCVKCIEICSNRCPFILFG